MNKFIKILYITLLTLGAFGAASAQGVQLKVSLDSAYVLMGKVTPLHVELVDNADSKGQLLVPADSMCGLVEILQALPADTTMLGNGRREIRQEILLQSFDSGTYMLKPILYVAGRDTVRSNRVALKVVPCDVDSMVTIHDYADAVDVHRHLTDYLPDWMVDYGLWIILGLLAVGIGIWLYINRRKAPQLLRKKEKPEPPYDRAMRELDALASQHLCEQGQEKQYYTELTDILRVYLQGRFGINAMEMTSTQIRQTLKAHDETKLSRAEMDRVLETADFVKFAKVRPLPDDNAKAFAAARKFVEDTKPAPVPAEGEEEAKTKVN